ncbi:MAG: toprim domain-containing protein [Fibromonadaceae bacterium]|jgi:DNA primase|nr:toprim domain-containing protein [Fibromonadaceae bacterium]
MLSSDELKRLKSELSITVVARRLGLQVARGRFRCFFSERHAHGDRTPSVSINEEKGYFKCFVCEDVKGDVISLVQMNLGTTFPEAIKWLCGDAPSIKRDMQGIRRFTAGYSKKKEQEATEQPKFFKEKILFDFLKLLSPIPLNSRAAWWLANRRIYKAVWDKVLLRLLDDYHRVSRELLKLHSVETLQEAGLFNSQGILRYGKHPLIIPYIDEQRRPFTFQARALDKSIAPKELNFGAPIPFPYNKAALDGEPGIIYLCEGAIDALTLLTYGFNAVGIPGANIFKPEWVEMFKNKKIILCLDNDEPGRAGEKRISALFQQAGFETYSFGVLPEGADINSWYRDKSTQNHAK